MVHQLELLVNRNGSVTWTKNEVETWLDEQQVELYNDADDDNPYWDEKAQQMTPWRTLGATP